LIDLHCHMLPGVDDGAPDLAAALDMARMAVDDGITATACTPHMMPGVWNNTAETIHSGVSGFEEALAEADIPLIVVPGADVHIAPDLVAALRAGRVPTLNMSRYFLFEPPHNVVPPRLEDFAFGLIAAGYVPILTHPERLAWIDAHYVVVARLAAAGVWMQITAGSLTGRFGRTPRHFAERMLDDGLVQIVATDAHDTERRPPRLSSARDMLAERLGEAAADAMVLDRPLGVLKDRPAAELAAPIVIDEPAAIVGHGRWRWGRR
jgi:protein-tyrosine phosphatase